MTARALVALAALPLAAAQSEFFFKVDNYCSIYYNGALLYTDVDWRIDYGTVVLQREPMPGDVVVIKGVDSAYGAGTGGILAWISNTDLWTNAADWKCIADSDFVASDACSSPEAIDCNTAGWPSAVEEDDADFCDDDTPSWQDDDAPYCYRGDDPFWRGEGYAPEAKYIWTSNFESDDTVWCRTQVPGGTTNTAQWCHDLHDWQHNRGRSKCMLDGTMQADTKMEFYYNNMLMASDTDVSASNSVTFEFELADRPQPGDVYAFHGWNTDIANPLHLGGIIARIGDSFDTVTNEYWKCSAEWEEGWAAPEFNDTHWRDAYVQEDDCCDYRSQSGGMTNVGAARWIWTQGRDEEVFCRYHIPLKGTTAWHVSKYKPYVSDGETEDEASSYYCGPKSSYGDIDAGNYPRMRADMLQTPPIEIPTGGGSFQATIKYDVEPNCGARYYTSAQCHNLMGCGGSALSAWDAAAVFYLDTLQYPQEWKRISFASDPYPFANSYGAIVNGLAENHTSCDQMWWAGASNGCVEGDTDCNGWRQLSVDLDSLGLSGTTARFGFLLVTDPYSEADGIWVDNMKVYSNNHGFVFSDSATTKKSTGKVIHSYFEGIEPSAPAPYPTLSPGSPTNGNGKVVANAKSKGATASAGRDAGMVFLGMGILLVVGAGLIFAEKTGALSSIKEAVSSALAGGGGGGGSPGMGFSSLNGGESRRDKNEQMATLEQSMMTSSGAGSYSPVHVETEESADV